MDVKKVPLAQYEQEVANYLANGYIYTMTGQVHKEETEQHKEKLPWCVITKPNGKWFVLYALYD